jgi:predicted NAD/FAD-binding protein
MWRLIFDIIRFNQFAIDLLKVDGTGDALSRRSGLGSGRPIAKDMTIGEYLDQETYSQTFRDDYLIPMIAAAWSTSPDKCSLQFPAITLARFLWNHHLLNTLSARPEWKTIPGGTKQYITAVLTDFPNQRIHLKSKVTSVAPNSNGIVFLP